MSRFSKADAEARGWVFVHDSPAEDIVTSEVQGEVRSVPRSIRAEKILSLPGKGSQVVNEEAESMGLLLERIHAFEAHHDQLRQEIVVPAVAPSAEPAVRYFADGEEIDAERAAKLQEAGQEVEVVTENDPRTVIVAGGRISEEEWSSRSQNDAIFDGEQMLTVAPASEALEADAESGELARAAEDAAKAANEIPHAQIEYDTADSIDAPGQSAGGVLVVREGEWTPEEVSIRRDAEKADAESERVVAAREEAEHLKAVEEGRIEIDLGGDEAEEPASDDSE